MLEFGLAREDELQDILKLYASMIGRDGCTWSEEYPGPDTLQNDFEADCLYVLRDAGKVIGAVSVVSENELDDLDCFKMREGVHREIARLCIAVDRQGRGLAKTLLATLFSRLYQNGCAAIRLLVAINNPAAIRAYSALGFEFLGECYRFGHHFHICERALNGEYMLDIQSFLNGFS